MTNEKLKCPKCGSMELESVNNGRDYKCPYCGTIVTPSVDMNINDMKSNASQAGASIAKTATSLANSATNLVDSVSTSVSKGNKNKALAIILSIFLGVIGAQYFYLKKNGLGILMLAITIIFGFFASIGISITALWGIIQGVIWLGMSNDDFYEKYNKK